MTSTEATIKLVPKDVAVASADAIEKLEAVLERVRAGDLVAVAIVGIHADGSNYSTFSATTDRLRFIGLLDWVRWRMVKAFDE